MESLCARQWWGDHWGGWGPSWLFHIAHCFPQGMSPCQPLPWGKQSSQSLFFWFHPRSFLLQPTSFLQVPQSIGLSTRKVQTFINITDIVSSLTVINIPGTFPLWRIPLVSRWSSPCSLGGPGGSRRVCTQWLRPGTRCRRLRSSEREELLQTSPGWK